jgi:hypothetical protein
MKKKLEVRRKIYEKRRFWFLLIAIAFLSVFSLYGGFTGFLVKDVNTNQEESLKNVESEDLSVFCTNGQAMNKIPCKNNEDCNRINMKKECASKNTILLLPDCNCEFKCNSAYICTAKILVD